MSKEMVSLIIPIAGLIVGSIVLIYHTYLIWFQPSRYAEKLIKGTKDWWPFAGFYRRWFASKLFLWLFRITYSITLLAIMVFLSITLFGLIGIFP